jgi:hypothetical protein
MAIDLGKWSWVAGVAVDFGLPILGTALGIPGPVSAFAISKIKRVLGLAPSASAEDVSTAIAADPDTAKAALEAAQTDVQAKYAYLTRLVEVQGEVAKANITAINQTIQGENKAKVPWYHWRHLIGYLVLAYGIVLLSLMVKVGFFKSSSEMIKDVIELFNATTPFTLGLFALLGAVAYDTTRRMSGVPPEQGEGVVQSTIKAVTGRTAPKK